MPVAKPQSEQDILRAMAVTKSNKAAARYLNISYWTYMVYAKLYFDPETGKTLYEMHKNQCGKGIPKFLQGKKKKNQKSQYVRAPKGELRMILNGEITTIDNYDVNTFKERLIIDAILEEKCCRCGFNEARIIDYKVPLLIHFKDTNRKNWKLENLQLVCYNCYYLTVGDVFTKKQIKDIESHIPQTGTGIVEWDMDEHMREHLKSLGLGDDDEPNKDDDFTAYKDYIK
jgi:hypothetical protein